MKVCNEFPGYQYRTIDSDGQVYSVPRFASDYPDDGIPYEAEVGIRRFIETVMPQFTSRPLVGARVCWCTDTVDSHWLIDRHPDFPKEVLLATGDSGHAFKMFPIIGKYIVRALEGDTETGLRPEWRYGAREAVKNVTRGPSDEVKDLKAVFDHLRV
jgi:sarcosine oxidase / L-pipecolate oxidase